MLNQQRESCFEAVVGESAWFSELKWMMFGSRQEPSREEAKKMRLLDGIEFYEIFDIGIREVNADQFRVAFRSVGAVAGRRVVTSRIGFGLEIVCQPCMEALVGYCASRVALEFVLPP